MKCKVAALGRNFQTLFPLEGKKMQVVVAFSPGKVFFSFSNWQFYGKRNSGSFDNESLVITLETENWWWWPNSSWNKNVR